jgi:photosystem II stability/assembly factor-like uncharacterized protein
VSADIVWASGVAGTYARTTDGGRTWTAGVVPGGDSLEFRDVHGVDSSTAYLLAAGRGPASRIYKTTDGGATWMLQFRNTEPEAFFDCFAFWGPLSGVAFSDAVDGRFFILVTRDGETWQRVRSDAVPAALPGEGSFAASGTCVIAIGDSTGLIGTGAAEPARVLRTDDRGASWRVFDTPVLAGGVSGIASLAFRDADNGIAVGGDIASPDAYTDNVAITSDGGRTWTLGGRPTFPGAVYGATYVPGAPVATVVAVGPMGAALSTDDGRTWAPLDTVNYWSVAFAGPSVGWLVGPGGRVVRVSLY